MDIKDRVEFYKDEVGRKIRELRKSKGLTLEELAVETEISKPHIHHIETGANVSLEKLLRLCWYFDITIGDLFGKIVESESELTEDCPTALLEAKKELEDHGGIVTKEAMNYALNFEFRNQKPETKDDYLNALKLYKEAAKDLNR